MIEKPYLLFLGDVRDGLAAKTAKGIVDWRPADCVGQLRLPGCQADMGISDLSIDDAIKAGAKTFLVGGANSGGVLPDSWTASIVNAIEAGMHVASGLHMRLTDNPAIAQTAANHGRQLHDVRHPTQSFKTGTGKKRSGKRMLCVGTDCSCGKMYTALAVEKALHEMGIAATFRATGQTGILITGGGVSIDAVVADFISGAVEQISPDNDAGHWDIIEGQGSLFHAAFAGVSLGLLHGAQADALVLCHEPTRTHMRGLPHMPIPSLEACVSRNLEAAQLTNPNARFVAASINTAALSEKDARALLTSTEEELGLPATDPYRFGADIIAQALLAP